MIINEEKRKWDVVDTMLKHINQKHIANKQLMLNMYIV